MKRIEAVKSYLVEILDTMQKKFETVNVNFLSNEVDNYSIDKVPTKSTVEETITGKRNCRDVYNFRSRNSYGSAIAENLKNIGFWEEFEDIIYSNNEKGVLPEIEGITGISCLDCGSLSVANTQDCEMSIQIEITYEK